MSEIREIMRDKNMMAQANKVIAKRSIIGSYIYLLIWFSIIIPHEFFKSSPDICLWLTCTFIVLAALRIALIINFDRFYYKYPSVWKIFFFSVVWLPALLWGILCAATLIHPVFESMSLAFIVSTAGLTGGGVAALVPSRFLTIGLITGYLIPTELALLFTDVYNPSVGIVFLIYWVGMFSVTRTQHREYWLSLKHSNLIKKYAADLEHLNTLDGLTGLKNRVFFDQTLKKEMKRAIRAQTYISLLFIDIDHFKRVNDRYGHLVGDECLRRISALLHKEVKRENDTVARYGGEEFAIILPNIHREKAVYVAEKIRRHVEKMNPDYGDLEVFITVSIGVASARPQPGASGEAFIEQADNALYKAKNNGRNQVM